MKIQFFAGALLLAGCVTTTDVVPIGNNQFMLTGHASGGLNAGKGTAGKLLKDDQLSKRLDELVARLNGTIDKINSGQGSLGQFLVNPQLYESLNGATREFQSLAKDMRANPKKFLTIRLTLF